MNADQLLAHYGRIADAPDAIPCLRRFILELAVRGKLVEQDPNDESASELLRRINTEKVWLVETKSIKKLEVAPVSEEASYFDVPSHWRWTRLGAIGNWGAGSTPSRGNPDLYGGGLTWLKSGELNDNTQLRGSEETVTELAVQKGSFRINRPGDVLIAMYGATIGKLAILAEEAVTNQAVCGCTPFEGVFNKYLFLFLLSQREDLRAASEGGAQPNISKVKIVRRPFPLPPLAEQHRIVAKVDELMALCDRLETARTARETTRDRLAVASLARLNEPDPDPDVFQNQVSFALDNLIPLTSRPDQIKALRQTILNLAVRGKLVEQDSNEEPVPKSTQSINAKRHSHYEVAIEHPFTLPTAWSWRTIGTIAVQVTDGEHATPPRILDQQIPLVTAKNVRDGYMDYAQTDWVSYETANKAWKRCCPQVNDLLLVCVGATTGRLTVLREPRAMVLVRSVSLIRPDPSVDSEYLERAIRSQPVQTQIWASVKAAAQPCLYINRTKSLLVPLPPLAEQRRIVAKVDELMALCDQLEASLVAGNDARGRLLDALLHETLAPTEQKSWGDISKPAQLPYAKPPRSPRALDPSTSATTPPE